MATIFHIAFAGDWAAAERAGRYTISTRGRTLAEEGFIHCSRGDQWPGVRRAFYGDVDQSTDPLVLLQIDTDRLGVPVVDEAPVPGSPETFPHVYGPVPVDAVVRVIPLDDAEAPAATGTPTPSFTRVFFAEMAFNAAMVLLVLVVGAAGIAVGALLGQQAGPGVAGVVGVACGAAAAVVLYRRRHRGKG